MNHEVKSAARVLELIEFLAGCSEPVSLKEITTELGYPKSSAHALAQTLVSRGYAIQDSTERYLLVHGNRHGSSFRAREARLLSAAHPVMESLRDRSGETVMLSVRTSRGEIKRLAKCVSRQAVRYDADLDAPAASYCTATGRVLLAYWEPAAVEAYFARTRLVAYTPFTVTDPARLREILAQVREEGVAINDQEFIAGSSGIAAPVRDREGQVAAALNLGTLTVRFHARRGEIIAAVKEAAGQVDRRFGYRDPLLESCSDAK
jgi:IclR family transcriptional regulator, pca regulon regulatory protein